MAYLSIVIIHSLSYESCGLKSQKSTRHPVSAAVSARKFGQWLAHQSSLHTGASLRLADMLL